MKKVYFTSEQLKHIIGEDIINGGSYLSLGDNSSFPKSSTPATDSEISQTETGGISRNTDSYGNSKIPNNMWLRRGNYSLYENKLRKNEDGEVIPDECPKCGSKVGIYIEGEPIYKCSNKKCGEFFGVVPFINERNAELDGKKIYSIPQEIRQFAQRDGVHDKIMDRLRSGEKMDIASLYRIRTELADSTNKEIKQAVNNLIKQAQNTGASLRSFSNNISKIQNNSSRGTLSQQSGHRKNGSATIYYEKN